MTQLNDGSEGLKKPHFLLLDSEPEHKGLARCSEVLKEHFKGAVCDLKSINELENKIWTIGVYDAVIVRCTNLKDDTLAFIKQIKFNLNQLPVILLSPKVNQERLIEAFKIGIDDYMRGFSNTLWRVPLKIERIIERNQLAKRLRGERDFSTLLIENANAMIIAVDFDGNTILFNKKIENATGYSRQSVIGKNLIEILIPKDKQHELYDLFLKYKSNHVIPVMETQIPLKTKDGRILLTSWNANALRNYEGKVIGTIGVGHDITAMKRLEEKLHVSEKLRTLGELASGVAHHFNNLLGIILRRTEILEKRLSGNKNIISDVEIIKQASLDGAETVKRIQNFARQEQPELKDVDLNEILQEVVEITSPKWREDCFKAGVKIQVDLTFSKIHPISGNKADLKELFTNLILNAVDAMPNGGRIFLETKAEADLVKVLCRDEGLGIDKESVKKIFNPFFTTKGNHGNGLGLSLAYDIVRRHKGEITVKSEPGKGAEFCILLPPSDLGKAVALDKIDKIKLESTSTICGQHILLIDDEEDYRSSTAELLKDFGHTVYTAATGKEALDVMEDKEIKVDIVLSDLTMPDMSGWEVIDKIKSDFKGTKVIVVSGHGGFLEQGDLKKHSVDYVLSKPCTVGQVQEAIEMVSEL